MSDRDGYEPIPLELDTPLLNRTQIFEDNEAINYRIDHDSNQHTSEVTAGNTAPVIKHTLNSPNPNLHVPASTGNCTRSVLITSDSMPRGMKGMKLSSKIAKKLCSCKKALFQEKKP